MEKEIAGLTKMEMKRIKLIKMKNYQLNNNNIIKTKLTP